MKIKKIKMFSVCPRHIFLEIAGPMRAASQVDPQKQVAPSHMSWRLETLLETTSNGEVKICEDLWSSEIVQIHQDVRMSATSFTNTSAKLDST